jgi:hypothetical protein
VTAEGSTLAYISSRSQEDDYPSHIATTLDIFSGLTLTHKYTRGYIYIPLVYLWARGGLYETLTANRFTFNAYRFKTFTCRLIGSPDSSSMISRLHC